MPLLAAVTYAGLQFLGLVGAHTDVAGTQRGAAAGAIVRLSAGSPHLSVRIEGVPVVAVPQAPSAYYGQATPAVGFFDGDLRVAVGRGRRWSVGLGETVINQRTPLPNLAQTVSSRLAGVRYALSYRQPLLHGRFLAIDLGGSTNLRGTDRFLYIDGSPPVNKDEKAWEFDGSAMIGIRRGASELLVGVRTIDFAAHFTATGEAGDRNQGSGVVVEIRRIL